MFSSFRNRFGIPGVISVIALVFAMLGGAYAASNDDGGKATASAKAKKGPRGPRGPAGPAGPAGPQGPAGAKGDTGAAGSNGSNGAPGSNGTNGQSVTANPLAPGEGPVGEECEEGGVELVSASGIDVICNGEEGAQGIPGEPWTPNGTLPPNATETGSWTALTGAAGTVKSSISFPIPLATELSVANVAAIKYPGSAGTGTGTLTEGSNVVTSVTGVKANTFVNSEISGTGIPPGTTITKVINAESKLELSAPVEATKSGTGVSLTTTKVNNVPADCESTHTGTASAANPEADPGFLCVYAGVENPEGATSLTVLKTSTAGSSVGASLAGAMVQLLSGGVSKEYWGTFAVTAAP